LFAISLARPAHSSASAFAYPTHSDPLLFKSPVIKNVWKDYILIFLYWFPLYTAATAKAKATAFPLQVQAKYFEINCFCI